MEVLSGQVPYHHLSELEKFREISRGKSPPQIQHPSIPIGVNVWKMMERCWAPRPARRPRMEEITREVCLTLTSWSQRSSSCPRILVGRRGSILGADREVSACAIHDQPLDSIQPQTRRFLLLLMRPNLLVWRGSPRCMSKRPMISRCVRRSPLFLSHIFYVLRLGGDDQSCLPDDVPQISE